jgi:hypothetical protein
MIHEITCAAKPKFYCALCEALTDSKDKMQEHLRGKTHKVNLGTPSLFIPPRQSKALKNFYSCWTCKMVFRDEYNFEDHRETERHGKLENARTEPNPTQHYFTKCVDELFLPTETTYDPYDNDAPSDFRPKPTVVSPSASDLPPPQPDHFLSPAELDLAKKLAISMKVPESRLIQQCELLKSFDSKQFQFTMFRPTVSLDPASIDNVKSVGESLITKAASMFGESMKSSLNDASETFMSRATEKAYGFLDATKQVFTNDFGPETLVQIAGAIWLIIRTLTRPKTSFLARLADLAAVAVNLPFGRQVVTFLTDILGKVYDGSKQLLKKPFRFSYTSDGPLDQSFLTMFANGLASLMNIPRELASSFARGHWKDVSYILRALTTGIDSIGKLGTMLASALKGLGTLILRFFKPNPVTLANKRTNKLLRTLGIISLLIGRSSIVASVELARTVKGLETEWRLLSEEIRSLPIEMPIVQRMSREMAAIQSQFKSLFAIANETLFSRDTRMKPTTIVFKGRPGIGKTTNICARMKQIWPLFHGEFPPNAIYTPNSKFDFFDDYEVSKHKVIQFNDPLRTKDSEVIHEFFNFFQELTETSPCVRSSANVTDNARNLYLAPEFVFLTCNKFCPANLADYVSEPSAISRRIDLACEVEIRPEFLKPTDTGHEHARAQIIDLQRSGTSWYNDEALRRFRPCKLELSPSGVESWTALKPGEYGLTERDFEFVKNPNGTLRASEWVAWSSVLKVIKNMHTKNRSDYLTDLDHRHETSSGLDLLKTIPVLDNELIRLEKLIYQREAEMSVFLALADAARTYFLRLLDEPDLAKEPIDETNPLIKMVQSIFRDLSREKDSTFLTFIEDKRRRIYQSTKAFGQSLTWFKGQFCWRTLMKGSTDPHPESCPSCTTLADSWETLSNPSDEDESDTAKNFFDHGKGVFTTAEIRPEFFKSEMQSLQETIDHHACIQSGEMAIMTTINARYYDSLIAGLDHLQRRVRINYIAIVLLGVATIIGGLICTQHIVNAYETVEHGQYTTETESETESSSSSSEEEDKDKPSLTYNKNDRFGARNRKKTAKNKHKRDEDKKMTRRKLRRRMNFTTGVSDHTHAWRQRLARNCGRIHIAQPNGSQFHSSCFFVDNTHVVVNKHATWEISSSASVSIHINGDVFPLDPMARSTVSTGPICADIAMYETVPIPGIRSILKQFSCDSIDNNPAIVARITVEETRETVITIGAAGRTRYNVPLDDTTVLGMAGIARMVSKHGDSGSLIVAVCDSPYIIGHQIGMYKDIVYHSILSQEILELMIEKIESKPRYVTPCQYPAGQSMLPTLTIFAVGNDGTVTTTVDREIIDERLALSTNDTVLNVVATVEKGTNVPTKTHFIHSPLYGYIDSNLVPAPLRPIYDINAEGKRFLKLNPGKIALYKYANRHDPFPADLRKICVDAIVQELCSYDTPYAYMGSLSEEVAINGVRGDVYLQPIARDTSVGYPHVLHPIYKERRNMFDEDEVTGIWTPKPYLREHIDKARAILESDKPYQFAWMDFWKDELIESHKAEAGKVRIVQCAPIEYLIIFRQELLPFLCHLMANHTLGFCAVGINVHSYEWKLLLDRLKNLNDKVICGDFPAMDKTVDDSDWYDLIDIIYKWMKAKGVKKSKRFLTNLLAPLFNSYHIVGMIIFLLTHGHPSGEPGTAVLNCLIILLWLMIAYVRLTQRPPTKFFDDIQGTGYGDDHLLAVTQSLESVYNMQTVASFFKEFKLGYTDPIDKLPPTQPFYPINNAPYLCRTFKVLKDRNWVAAPRNLNDMFSGLSWMRRSENQSEVFLAQLNAFFLDLWHHGRKTYDRIMTDVVEALHEEGYPVPNLPTFDSIDLKFKFQHLYKVTTQIMEDQTIPEPDHTYFQYTVRGYYINGSTSDGGNGGGDETAVVTAVNNLQSALTTLNGSGVLDKLAAAFGTFQTQYSKTVITTGTALATRQFVVNDGSSFFPALPVTGTDNQPTAVLVTGSTGNGGGTFPDNIKVNNFAEILGKDDPPITLSSLYYQMSQFLTDMDKVFKDITDGMTQIHTDLTSTDSPLGLLATNVGTLATNVKNGMDQIHTDLTSNTSPLFAMLKTTEGNILDMKTAISDNTKEITALVLLLRGAVLGDSNGAAIQVISSYIQEGTNNVSALATIRVSDSTNHAYIPALASDVGKFGMSPNMLNHVYGGSAQIPADPMKSSFLEQIAATTGVLSSTVDLTGAPHFRALTGGLVGHAWKDHASAVSTDGEGTQYLTQASVQISSNALGTTPRALYDDYEFTTDVQEPQELAPDAPTKPPRLVYTMSGDERRIPVPQFGDIAPRPRSSNNLSCYDVFLMVVLFFVPGFLIGLLTMYVLPLSRCPFSYTIGEVVGEEEVAQPHQEELTQFEETPVTTAETTSRPGMDYTPMSNPELQKFFSRPIIQKEITLDGSLQQGSFIAYFDPLAFHIADPVVHAHFRGMKYLRTKLTVGLKVNATKFHYGLGVMFYVPPSRREPKGFPADSIHYYASFKRAVFFNLQDEENVEIEVPWLYPERAIDLEAYQIGNFFKPTLGHIAVMMISPLGEGKTLKNISIAITTRMEQTELSGYTFNPFLPPVPVNDPHFDIQHPPAKVADTYLMNELMRDWGVYVAGGPYTGRHPMVLTVKSTREEMGATKTGIVSTSLAAVSTLANVATLIPGVGGVASAIGTVAGMGSRIAQALGYNKPVDQGDNQRFQAHWSEIAHGCKAVQKARRLAIDPSNHLDTRFELMCGHEQDMEISTIVQRPYFQELISLNEGQQPGTIIWTWHVSPVNVRAFSSTANYENQGPGMIDIAPSFLSHAAMSCRYARGSLVLKIKRIRSGFHNGRYRLSYIPGQYLAQVKNNGWLPPADMAIAQAGAHVSSVVFSLTDEDQLIVLDIPFQREVNWVLTDPNEYTKAWYLNAIPGDNPGDPNNDSGFVAWYTKLTYGLVQLEVVNRLTHSQEEVPDCWLAVWSHAGSDFQLARPITDGMTSGVCPQRTIVRADYAGPLDFGNVEEARPNSPTDFVYTGFSSDELANAGGNVLNVENVTVMHPQALMGEEILHVKQLLTRTHMVQRCKISPQYKAASYIGTYVSIFDLCPIMINHAMSDAQTFMRGTDNKAYYFQDPNSNLRGNPSAYWQRLFAAHAGSFVVRVLNVFEPSNPANEAAEFTINNMNVRPNPANYVDYTKVDDFVAAGDKYSGNALSSRLGAGMMYKPLNSTNIVAEASIPYYDPHYFKWTPQNTKNQMWSQQEQSYMPMPQALVNAIIEPGNTFQVCIEAGDDYHLGFLTPPDMATFVFTAGVVVKNFST